MDDLPRDPFAVGDTEAERLIETGRMLAENMLQLCRDEDVINAIFALSDEDLRAIVLILVAHGHPAFDVSLSVGISP